MKIVIFGTGMYYESRRNSIINEVEIVAFIDNNPALWGKKKNGIDIYSPNAIKRMVYDKIVLMSLSSDEMMKQLLDMGITKEKINYYDEFYAELKKGKMEIYFDNITINKNKRILIAIHALGFHGASIIALSTARALKEKGYQVTLIAADGDKNFINAVIKEGFLVLIYGGIFYVEAEEMFWIKYFDYVIVNTYFLMRFAFNVSKLTPSLLWLHEAENAYKHISEETGNFQVSDVSGLNIFAVSEVAAKNFNDHYPLAKIKYLKYGIPDKNINHLTKKNKEKLIFAIIGYVSKIKGQDIFINAIKKLSDIEKEGVEFWIIGKIGDDIYSQEIKKFAEQECSIKILGEFNQDEMEKAYSHIDVVINSSRQDVFPTVIAEGLMYGKVCITTDVTGMAPLIKNGENGFVCKSDDAEDLCSRIRWILLHRDVCEKIEKNARQTYLEHFTMEKFSNRLEAIIVPEI